MAKSNADNKPIRFKVAYEGKPEKPIDAVLYAFDDGGTLLATAPLREGEAALPLSADQLRRARLFIAPELPKGRAEKPTLQTMERVNAYAPAWRFERGRDTYELQPIPEILWPWWYWCSCRVRGRVVKVETLGGVTYEKPVCHARVHICEVDRVPWLIARLPDDLILRLRDELIRAIERPIPIPDPNPPDPPYRIDPGFIDPAPVLARAASLFGKADQVMLNPQPLPPRQLRSPMSARAGNVDTAMLNPQPLPPRQLREPMSPRAGTDASVMLNPQPEPPSAAAVTFESLAALRAGSTQMVRDALLKNVELVKIYWCYWDWLTPWFRYACDETAVVETDGDGRFDITIWYPCFGDKPDLYFWVEYSIGEVWTSVYHPSIRCHTYWNYVCGSEVTIRITDSRVHGCGDKPELLGKKIVVKTIGRQVSMGEIYRDSLVPAEKLKEGQVKEGWIDTVKPSPFGATLEPRVDFGNGLKPADITHYRWSYRPLGSVSEADWQVIDAPVSRHYRETTPPMSPVIYKSLQIGPDTTVPGYYTIIDPALPAGGEDWEVLDESYDLASAYFKTSPPFPATPLSPGKYELKMELFRKVGAAMVRVDLTAETVELYEITDPAPLVEGSYTTTPAVNDRTLIDSGTGHVVGYRLVLHVDNRQCFGTIEDVTVNGVLAGQCGFLEYSNLSDIAHIAFRASHPANFASFHFRVVRVSTQVNEATASGLVDAPSVPDAAGSATPFTRVGDTFSKDVTINTLMTSGLPADQTPCTRAAFGEALHVYALATDGYYRLYQYDGPVTTDPLQVDLKAFAITPA